MAIRTMQSNILSACEEISSEKWQLPFVLLCLSLVAQFTPQSNQVCVSSFFLDRILLHSPFYFYRPAHSGCSKVAESELFISGERITNGEATVLKVAGGLRWERKPQQGEKKALQTLRQGERARPVSNEDRDTKPRKSLQIKQTLLSVVDVVKGAAGMLRRI